MPIPPAPVAVADAAMTTINVSALIAVLDNDTGDNLAVTIATQPTNGTATVENGAIRYTPKDDFIGNDDFTYTITDILNRSATTRLSSRSAGPASAT